MANIIERTGSDVTFSKEVCERIISLEKQAKEIKKQQDSMKNEILDAMQKYGVLKIDNEFLKIALIPEHDAEKFDSKAFKEENPDIYDSYVKLSKVKPSIRITVKWWRHSTLRAVRWSITMKRIRICMMGLFYLASRKFLALSTKTIMQTCRPPC